MYCKNCGADIPDNAVFCGNCGMKVDREAPKTDYVQAPEQKQTTYQTYQQAQQSRPQYQQVPPTPPQYQQTNVHGEVKTTLWIILSIIEIVTCCAIIPGIIGLVLSIMAGNKAGEGKIEEANANLKGAKIAIIIGAVLVLFGGIGGIISAVTGAASDVINQMY